MIVYVGNQIENKLFPHRNRKGIILYDSKLEKEANALINCLPNTILKGFRVTERIKDLSVAEKIYTKMIREKLDRNAILVSLGGGALGDLSGFVASTYLRGIDWINIPTTLVGQIDAAIGGKTAVNHPLGKNLIGTFYPPKMVLCNPVFLKTLPIRERISGFGEMIKYGLTFDPFLYRTIERNWETYLNLEKIESPIRKCIKIKEEVVQQDERDTLGLRQVLNFGHTFGHAIEAATDYKLYRHGEAVIQGMRIALVLSVLQGHMAEKEQESIDRFLSSIPMPTKKFSPQTLIRYTEQDKKRKQGKIGFVLLKKMGEPIIDETVTKETMVKALKRFS